MSQPAEMLGSDTVLVESSFDLPLVSLSVGIRLGAIADPDGLEGATRLLARLMRRTAGGRSPDDIDTEVDSIGAAISVDVSSSTLQFHGTVILRSLPRFVDLIGDIIARPGLSVDEFERLKRETAAELVETLDDDRSLVRRWFRRKLFQGHAYGRPLSGTATTLRAIQKPHLEALYSTLFVRENLVFAWSGSIDRAQAEHYSARLASSLKSGIRSTDKTPEPALEKGRRLVIVDKPERTQTQILIGGSGSHPADPDHFALVVANTVFGGTFTARLMQEVRAKRGWSYGAHSNIPYDRRRQAFSMWTFPKAADAAACIELELQMLSKWKKGGITKAELSWSKRYLTRSHAFAIDTAGKRVSLVQDAELYGLPPGYYEKYLDSIRAVTVEQANQAVETRISDQDLLITVVGTESQIGTDIRKAIADLSRHEVIAYDSE